MADFWTFYSKAVATGFGSGLIRPAPGTWGSAAAALFGFGIWELLPSPFLMPVLAIVSFALGWHATDIYCKRNGVHDPSEVVMDEFAGIFVTLSFAPLTPWTVLAGFLLFRLFDIWKPWPIRWADRSIEGAFGVMFDDVLAGLIAGILLMAGTLVLGTS